MKQIYLDYAAATPIDSRVLEAMKPYFQERFYNPSATYLGGRGVRRELEAARFKIAGVLGAKPAEVIFTAGATEANNLAIRGVMEQYPYGELLVSAIEHESVLAPAGLFKTKKISVDTQGIVKLDSLEDLIGDKTVLVSVMLVNNETGVVQPIGEIAKILRQIRKNRKSKGIKLPLYLHTDAAQAPCYLDLHASRLGIDLMTVNGGKIYGPKQSGALYISAGIGLKPLVLGGGQESGLRSGTENVVSCIGLAEALTLAAKLKRDESQRVHGLRELFISGLARIPGTAVNGSTKHSAPHIVSVTFPRVDNERLMMELDELGIQVAAGSACSASEKQPSHVLAAMGLSNDSVRSTLRFSFGRQTTAQDTALVIKLLKQRAIVAK